MTIPIAITGIVGEIVERFEDYAIAVNVSDCIIQFEVSRIIGEHVSGGPDIPGAWLYYSCGANDNTTDFRQAERFLSGSIRCDGCSNWDFHTTDCMVHFCGRKAAVSIGGLMNRLFDIASERLPTYDKSLAED